MSVKHALNKDIKKSITHSLGRFVSIILLMALGSFALVGLAVTGPDMRQTGSDYFAEYNTADLTIASDYGISETEMQTIESASNVSAVEYIYLKDVTVENQNTSFRIFSAPKNISMYELVDGNLPTNDQEIAIDSTNQGDYQIGDQITFTEPANTFGLKVLKNTTFTITGFIKSTEILSTLNRGQTTVGTGALDNYAVVDESVFDSSVYMMAKIIFSDTANLDPYSDEYNEKIISHKNELENLLSEDKSVRFDLIKSEYKDKIDAANLKLTNAKQELENARTSLADAEAKINQAKQTISANQQTLNSAKKQLNQAEKTLKASKTTLNEKKQNIASYKDQLASALVQIQTSEQKLAAANQELTASEQLIAAKEAALDAKYAELAADDTASRELLDSQRAELNQAKQVLSAKRSEYEQSAAKLELAQREYDNNIASYNSALEQLQAAEAQINYSESLLNSKKQTYQSGIKSLAIAQAELNSKESEYYAKLAEYNSKLPEANSEIADGEAALADAEETYNSLESPVYHVYNRREIPGGDGYSIYETVSNIVDSIAAVFPLFMYFVAALVTLTTMTRFVDEERINMGTLTSLGYRDRDIIKKFVIYGFLSAFIGTLIGVIAGHILIPYIVYNAYGHGFTVPKIELHFYLKETIIACILSLLCSVLPAYLVAKNNLKEKPANLLLPKAPASGSKILLEKIKPIWRRLSFTKKVTARNIFRYKKRMLMTIFGVAGASAMLFTGFSVQQSISTINEKQFQNIIKYDAIVALNDSLKTSESAEVNDLLASDAIAGQTQTYYESVTVTTGRNNDEQEINLIAPANLDDFAEYIDLHTRIGQNDIALDDDGVVISERLATSLGLKVGDTFTFKDSKDVEHEVKVSAICEMYAGHFIFMSLAAYAQIYDSDYHANAYMLLLHDSSEENTQKVSADFMALSATKTVVQNTTMSNLIDTIVKSLNKIMLVIIILAALLTIVILFNLTNINVAERIRELSTIKVLGFRDREVTMYIYRETIILSQIGIVAGWLFGIWLHNYILTVVPPDQVMFDPDLWFGAFIIPFVVINIVTFALKFYINRKLINVDMIEALKSVD